MFGVHLSFHNKRLLTYLLTYSKLSRVAKSILLGELPMQPTMDDKLTLCLENGRILFSSVTTRKINQYE